MGMPCLAPSSLILAAMTSAPLATTFGAPLVASYLMATETWVGLTTMASALAISAIMRSLLMRRWAALIWPFTMGSPSDWRASSLISCLLIIMLLASLRRCMK